MHLLYRLLTFFKITFFKKKTFWKHTVLNGLDPDQDRRAVGPDLGPNRLQRLPADDKIRRWQETARDTMPFSMLDNLSSICYRLLTFFKIIFLKNQFFLTQSAKRIGSR